MGRGYGCIGKFMFASVHNLIHQYANYHSLFMSWGNCYMLLNFFNLFSGDVDSVCSVMATKYAIKKLKLHIMDSWKAWYSNGQVGALH